MVYHRTFSFHGKSPIPSYRLKNSFITIHTPFETAHRDALSRAQLDANWGIREHYILLSYTDDPKARRVQTPTPSGTHHHIPIGIIMVCKQTDDFSARARGFHLI